MKMPAFQQQWSEERQALEQEHRLRRLTTTCSQSEGRVLRNGRAVISFSGNDYLGLSQHPALISAAQEATEQYGLGAGASRLVTGNHPAYEEAEAALANHKKTEAACLFGSGYLANIGAIPALAGAEDLILADKLVHACMVDGMRLSGARWARFRHNDLVHLEQLLKQKRAGARNCLILTETVFSMDGDRAPLAAMESLAQAYDAVLMVDDAHGFGVIHQHFSPHTIQMGTLSKAAGSYGGYVAASKAAIEMIHQKARSLIYSTALPPAIIAATVAALELMRAQQEPSEPLRKARLFTSLAGLPAAQSAVVPIILGDNQAALKASLALEEQGFLVVAIRPPTVPEGTARLRFSFSAAHTDADVSALAHAVKSLGLV